MVTQLHLYYFTMKSCSSGGMNLIKYNQTHSPLSFLTNVVFSLHDFDVVHWYTKVKLVALDFFT